MLVHIPMYHLSKHCTHIFSKQSNAPEESLPSTIIYALCHSATVLVAEDSSFRVARSRRVTFVTDRAT